MAPRLICALRSFPRGNSMGNPWPRRSGFAIPCFSSKYTPRRANAWPGRMLFTFATCTAYGFYCYSTTQPLLCEAPVRPDKDLAQKPSGSYQDLFNYPTLKYINSLFPANGTSMRGDPAKGLLRYDDFSMTALEPREEFVVGASMANRDENGDDLPGGLCWASWGVVDGHAGPYTAIVVKELLLEYVVDELFLKAGIDPHSPYRDTRPIFQDRPMQEVIQAMSDAFERLDNDILKKATHAITGSIPLQASLQDLAPAESSCSAVLATYDTASRYLYVANVGSSKAVLGHRNAQGTWQASPLSVDHTCQNEDEVARLRAEHPNEADMIKDGRLLGKTVTRAFGDLRWKLSARIQSIAHTRLFGHPLLPSFLTPPYVTAAPSISATKIDPTDKDFVILASDGLWDHLTGEQAVRLVGLWLARNDPSEPLIEERPAEVLDVVVADSDEDVPRFWERLQQGLIARKPEDLPAPGRDYSKVKYGDEKNWVVVDDNAATHLARNALGGADEDLFCALAEASMYPMRKLRDDLTIQVIFFGYGEHKTRNLKLSGDDPNSSDTLDLA